MAFYVDFNDGSASIPDWTATGDFTLSYRTVYIDKDEITLGRSDTLNGWMGPINGAFKIRIGTTATNTLIPIINGQEVIVTISRTGTTVSVDVSGSLFSFTNSQTLVLNKIGGNTSTSYVGTVEDLYYINLDNNAGDVRTYNSDGVGLPDTTGGAGNDATLTGTYTFVEYTPPATGGIVVANAAYNNFVYQRDVAGSANISFAITYTGTPTALQYRLLDAADDTTEITTWATFDASPTGLASTLNITRAGTLTPAHVEVRFLNDTAETDLQTSDWYVGDNILIFGQSLSQDMNTDGAVTAPAGYFVYNGTTSAAPTTGVGAETIAEGIINTEGVAVCVTNTGSSGSALTVESGDAGYWNDPTGTLWTTTASQVNSMTATSNNLAFAWWHQGTRDALASVSKAAYSAALTEFFTRVRTSFGGKGGNTLPVFFATLGRDTRGSDKDVNSQAIRDAQLEYLATDVESTPVGIFPIPLVDGVHATDAGYILIGEQILVNYYANSGVVTGSSPIATSFVIGDSATEIDINYDSNLLTSESVYSIDGVRVEDNGTPLTVTGFARKDATTATITVTETPVGSLAAWVGYGAGVSSGVLAYPKSELITLPSTGGNYSLTSDVFSAAVVSVSSTLNITATGIPNGTYKTIITNPTNDAIVFAGNLLYTAGSSSTGSLSLIVGTPLTGYVIDNEATPVDGAVITGTTV